MGSNNFLYETDFVKWTEETSERLRNKDFSEIDIQALAEEIGDLGKKEKSALQNRLGVLIGHLLKWDKQPLKRSNSWKSTIALQRKRIERLLEQSPSLRLFLVERLADAYDDGILLASKETGMAREAFPVECPWSVEEILGNATTAFSELLKLPME